MTIKSPSTLRRIAHSWRALRVRQNTISPSFRHRPRAPRDHAHLTRYDRARQVSRQVAVDVDAWSSRRPYQVLALAIPPISVGELA